MGCGGSKHAGAASSNTDHRPNLSLHRSNPLPSSFTRKISPIREEVSGDEASSFSSASTHFTDESEEDKPATLSQTPRERKDKEDKKIENQGIPLGLCRNKKDARVENLKRQLQQLKEDLAKFEAWCLEEGDSSSSKEEEEDNYERDNPFRTPSLERESSNQEEEEDDDDDDEDAAAADDDDDEFEEDFTNKVPVYDEDPFDHLQEVPASHLSIDCRGSDNAKIDQAPAWRSKSYGSGSEGKKTSIYHQPREGKIRKSRRRKIRASQGRLSVGSAR